jgi:hypothetical protein
MTWRYIAQRAVTGEFLDMELPLHRDELKWDLSGAGSLRGTVTPDIGAMRADDGRLLLEEWGTLIYAEADGEIRWGGIVISSNFDGAAWKIEAAGFATYPHGIPYTGKYSRVGIDPAAVVADIWDHVQSYSAGNLGVTVSGATSARIGTATKDNGQDGPYELNWWDAPDCGGEIDSLAKETPFDYMERHAWDGDDITHEIIIGYPRLGRRRDDLAFIQGDNITNVVTPELDGDVFANEIVGIGAGEGAKSVHKSTAIDDGRLRRPYVYTAKDVTSSGRMDALIRGELQRRQQTLAITSVDVRDHPNARLGSWSVGDDVLIQATIPWLGDVDLWCRIVGWALTGDYTATLSLARSDAFTYGG